MMSGERLWSCHQFGSNNSPHQGGYFSGGAHRAFGVLGPRRERHNKIAKRQANKQRRSQDRRLTSQEE